MNSAVSLRYPDFLIPGVKKSGSTTLHRWLQAHPGVHSPVKEPNYFCDDRVHARGPEWYASLFEAARPDERVGEASVECMDPNRAAVAARRIAELVPDARLVVILREPVARIRSHYRHEVQKGRERKPMLEVLEDPSNRYCAQSSYHRCLEPYFDAFGSDQLLVVRFEDLVSEQAAWGRVLEHIGVDQQPAPMTAHNLTSEKHGYTPAFAWLRDSRRVRTVAIAQRVPASIRRRLRPLAFRDDRDFMDRLARSEDEIPENLLTEVRRDSELLHRELGVSWG